MAKSRAGRTDKETDMESFSRRGFLKTSAAVAAASAAASKPASANDKIQFAVLGCRSRGPSDAKYFIKTGQFDIVSLCDCDDEMIAKALLDKRDIFKKEPKKVKDFRRVLEDKDVDAVVVATPDHWHAQMCVMALDAGKHVYLEKPASFNIDDGKAMVKAQQKHPELAVQVGTQQRSGQHFRDAKEFIASGGLGKVSFCRASFVTERHLVPVIPDTDPPDHIDYDMWVGPAPIRPYNENLFHYNWHFLHDIGTGDMGNWGAHWLDVLRWLLDLDLPRSVSAYGGQYVVRDAKEWPDTQTVMYQFPELTMVWELRHWSRFMPGGGEGNCCEIDGDKGSITINRHGWTFHSRDQDAKPEQHGASDLSVSHAQCFADAVRGMAKPSAPIEEGHKSAVLCHLGNIACRLNRSVKFDPESQMVTGDHEAAAMMGRPYRAPWRLEDYL